MTKIEGSDDKTFGEVAALLFPGKRISSTNGGWPCKEGTIYTIRCRAQIAVLVLNDDGWFLKEPIHDLPKADVEYLDGPSQPREKR